MGNRAAVYFQDYDRNGVEQDAIAIYMHWNGGPESIYALTKELATYANSQAQGMNMADRDGNGIVGDKAPAVGPSAMACRFLQLTTNFMNGSSSDFLSVYLNQNPGSPKDNRIETENDVYVIRPDFAIERFEDGTGRKWTDEERLNEFEFVTKHHYWTGEDWELKRAGKPTPEDERHTIFDSIRETNDTAFLKAYTRDGEQQRWHERKETTLPVERELAEREMESFSVASRQPTLSAVAAKVVSQRELEL